MCLAIMKPIGKTIPPEHLREAAKTNNDGYGCCWAEAGKVVAFRTMSPKKLLVEVAKHTDKTLLVHLRKASHGRVNVQNCHPFLMLEGEYGLIHNGILSGLGSKDISDTWMFTCMLEPLLRSLGTMWNEDGQSVHPVLDYWVSNAIGGNKIALIDKDGGVLIWNKSSWSCKEVDGIWYSNSSFEKYVAPTTYLFPWQSFSYQVPTQVEDKKPAKGDDKKPLTHFYRSDPITRKLKKYFWDGGKLVEVPPDDTPKVAPISEIIGPVSEKDVLPKAPRGQIPPHLAKLGMTQED